MAERSNNTNGERMARVEEKLDNYISATQENNARVNVQLEKLISKVDELPQHFVPRTEHDQCQFGRRGYDTKVESLSVEVEGLKTVVNSLQKDGDHIKSRWEKIKDEVSVHFIIVLLYMVAAFTTLEHEGLMKFGKKIMGGE